MKPWLAYLLALVGMAPVKAPACPGRLSFETLPWPGAGGSLHLPVMVWRSGPVELVWFLEESVRWHRFTRYTEN